MQALILAGGSGTRFWPLSRSHHPKQFLALEQGGSLLQATVQRLDGLLGPESVWISTTEELAPGVRAQLPTVPEAQVLAEPVGRNTAPAIGWSLASMPAERRAGVVAVLPADHRVEDPIAFCEALAVARDHVLETDHVMTLGVQPHRPETGYGYLELGATPVAGSPIRQVVRFTEKPDLATAERFVESGDYLWNAGIFVFRGDRLLELLGQFEPEIGRALDAMKDRPAETAELYASMPSISIDYAVMERVDGLGTVPLDCGWSDLGSWTALAEVLEIQPDGNVHRGDTLSVDGTGNLLFADEGMVATVGVSDLVVVRTSDAVLVVPKERAQEVKKIVDALRQSEREELL